MREAHRGMKRKTIRKILRAKIDDWLSSIDDLEVRKVAAQNVIVTGGSITSMLLGEQINDFDVYMRTKDSTVTLAKHYIKQFNELNSPEIEPFIQCATLTNIKGEVEDRVCVFVQSAGAVGEGVDDSNYQYYEVGDIDGTEAEQYVNQIIDSIHGDKLTDEEAKDLPAYRPVFMSQNAITLKGKIQFVIRFYGEPSKIHDNYDFQHAMCSYDYHNDILDIPAEALECMMSKTLIYKGSLYPICSVFRTKKFIERGWQISAGQMLKMCWQISEIDLKNRAILREQLTGVDAAYFYELITLLDKEQDLLGKDKEIDSSYVVTLIDKVFGE